MAAEKFEFQAEVKQLLDLMIPLPLLESGRLPARADFERV